jgi:hypothetical protein
MLILFKLRPDIFDNADAAKGDVPISAQPSKG